MISNHDRENVDRIMGGYGDWFTAQLLRLCAKADSKNLERIRVGFPEVVELFEEWQRTPHTAGLPEDYWETAE